jgi:hypothetical protein
VFNLSGVKKAHAHCFRHALATELLGQARRRKKWRIFSAISPDIVRKHYGKWSPARQNGIDELMDRLYVESSIGVKVSFMLMSNGDDNLIDGQDLSLTADGMGAKALKFMQSIGETEDAEEILAAQSPPDVITRRDRLSVRNVVVGAAIAHRRSNDPRIISAPTAPRKKLQAIR